MNLKVFIFLFFFLPVLVYSQDQRYYLPREIQEAYKKESRSPDGKPGKNYFQNKASYNINVEYNPHNRMVSANAEIVYFNNSPDKLNYIVFRLYQNIFLKGGVRGRNVNPSDLHEGMKITNLEINGQTFDSDSHIYKSNTNVIYPVNLGAGEKAKIFVEWNFIMPSKTGSRFGCYNPGACFIAYWYPQISVYDDLNGWDTTDYNGVAEFYSPYADYKVNIAVPKNYIVLATGELENPGKILSPEILERYMRAKSSDETVQILEKKDLKQKAEITLKKVNKWKFTANNVSDFAFSVSNNYLWEASSIIIKDEQADKRIMVEAAYDPSSRNFHRISELGAWSLQDYSSDFPGVPYPYPKLSIFQGKDGMEYPMMINIGDSDYKGVLFVTTHEIAHTYFPFLVGTNQKRYGWIDEGLVTMLGQEQHSKKEKTYDFHSYYLKLYPKIAGTQDDIPPIVNSIYLSDDIFQCHEYMRPSLAFWTLRDILGEETFKKCLKAFIDIWKGKSPSPWDMFFTFENIAGIHLDWFFNPWFCEYAYPDLEISDIINGINKTEIKIKNSGGMPFPSRLKLTLQNEVEVFTALPADIWMKSSEYTFTYEKDERIISAEIITEGYPDVNIENNFMMNILP